MSMCVYVSRGGAKRGPTRIPRDLEGWKERTYSYESGTLKSHNILKTEIPDVYEVWNKEEKIGIAHIPNLKTSHLCQRVFRNKTKAKMKCVFYSEFQKWIPLECSN